jgi:hypothetical protein
MRGFLFGGSNLCDGFAFVAAPALCFIRGFGLEAERYSDPVRHHVSEALFAGACVVVHALSRAP